MRAFRQLIAWFVPTGPDGVAMRRNVGWLAGDRLFRLAVGLVINVWLIRYLGADRLGLLGFVHSLVVLFSMASDLGLESIVVRELVRRPREAGRLIGTSLGLRLAGAAITLLFSVGAILMLRPDDPTALALAMILGSVTFGQAFDVIASWFQGRTAFGPYVGARAVGFVAGSIAKVACLLLGASLEWIAAAMALEYAVAALAMVVAYYGSKAERHPWQFRLSMARELLRASWPLMLSGLAIVVYSRTDQVMLTLMRGEFENGIYAAAQRLSEILYFLPAAIVASATPALHRSFERNRKEYDQRLQRLLSLLAWLALAAAVTISLMSNWLTATLFGSEYARSGPVLALHVWAAPAVFLGVGANHWFIARGRQTDAMWRTLIGAGLNVGLNAVLIPRFGAVGAAVSTLVSQLMSMVVLNAVFPSTRELFRMQLRSIIPVRRG